MFFNKNGEPTVSQFSTFMQDLQCPNPQGYSKSQIFIAAAIDLFFLPYDDISVTALRDISDVCGLIFLFFIVEEFISTNWVAVTVKRGLVNTGSFFPVYLGIVVGCTVILKNRFGDYFMQYKKFPVAFLNLASWALETPKNNLDEDVDLLNDNQSWYLGIYFLGISFFVLVVGARIFVSISMEAYVAAKEQEGQNFKYRKTYYFLVNQKELTLKRTQLFYKLFPNLKDEIGFPKPPADPEAIASIIFKVSPGLLDSDIITEQRRIEKERLDRNAELERRGERKQRTVAAAHFFR